MRNLILSYAFLFALGFAGAHRFYLGRTYTAVLYLCTGGLCGIGLIVDFFMIPFMVAEDINDDLAKILENKYSSLEIIIREPEIPVQSKISDIELLDQVGKLDDIGYNDLKKLAVDQYQFKYRDTMVKKTKLIEMIQQKKKEKFN